MTTSKIAFLDSNILIYAADTKSPFHGHCKKLIQSGLQKKLILCLSPQVLLEFFAVVTNPLNVLIPDNKN